MEIVQDYLTRNLLQTWRPRASTFRLWHKFPIRSHTRSLSLVECNQSKHCGYHPQTDGLVEKFNSTLINMIAKCCEKSKDWDKLLPYLLFAYRANIQDSTKESPFFLLYGRDPHVPSDSALNSLSTPCMVDLEDYEVRVDK